MKVEPDFSIFSKKYKNIQSQVVWTTIVADLETPVSAMLKIAMDLPNSFLLESVEGGSARGQYSIIGLYPDVIWRCNANKAEINPSANTTEGVFAPCKEGALDSLRKLVNSSRIELPNNLPPMAAGLVGYLGYDMVSLMEDIPSSRPDTLGTPDGLFVRPTIMAIFDIVKDTITIVTPVRHDPYKTPKDSYAAAICSIKEIINLIPFS